MSDKLVECCPLCGARPHHGLGKVQHCSLHGGPFQDFSIWCPKGHVKVTSVNEEVALREWNTRAPSDRVKALEAALVPFARAETIHFDMTGPCIRMVLTYPVNAKQTASLKALDLARTTLKDTSHG